MGIALEKWLGKRQGQRTDRQSLVQNSAHVQSGKKTRDLIAELLGFGSHFTYQEAKKIKSLSAPALIDAVDKASLSISTAALLTKLPQKEQTQVLVFSIKEVISIASQLRKQKTVQHFKLTGVY